MSVQPHHHGQVLHVLEALQCSPPPPTGPARGASQPHLSTGAAPPLGIERGASAPAVTGASPSGKERKSESDPKQSTSGRKADKGTALSSVEEDKDAPPSVLATERAISKIATPEKDGTKARHEQAPVASSPTSGPATDVLAQAQAQAETAKLAQHLSQAEADAMTAKMAAQKSEQDAAQWQAKYATLFSQMTEYKRRAEESEKQLGELQEMAAAMAAGFKEEKAGFQEEVLRLQSELLERPQATEIALGPAAAAAAAMADAAADEEEEGEAPDGVFDENRPTFDEDDRAGMLADLGDSYRPTMGERPSMAEVLDACDMGDFVDRMSEYAEDVEEILELEDGDYDDMGVSEEQRAILKEAVQEVAETGRLTFHDMEAPDLEDLGPQLPSLERVFFVSNLMHVYPLLADLGIEGSNDLLDFLQDDQANGFDELGLAPAVSPSLNVTPSRRPGPTNPTHHRHRPHEA